MKTKKTSSKLTLNKITISDLKLSDMSIIKGGDNKPPLTVTMLPNATEEGEGCSNWIQCNTMAAYSYCFCL